MKRNKFILPVSLLLAFTLLTSCSGSEQTTTAAPAPSENVTTAAPAQTTAAVQTDVPHRDIVYPDTIDFSNEEEIIDIFWMEDLMPGLTTKVNGNRKQITQSCTINGVDFSLTVGLNKWAGRTTPEQIVQCARTFWYCYPQMYDRFQVANTPTNIILNIENEGYEVASTSGNTVHLYDGWLEGSKTDFDCLTHEFAHVVQSGWDGGFVPSDGSDTYMIERFADYCRFVYSYNNGYYNDSCWTLQTSKTENSFAKGVRFWVWLDYTYSTEDIDIMQRLQQEVAKKDRTVIARNWKSNGSAWKTVFAGTGAAGKTLDQLWDEYAATELANLSSNSPRPTSQSPLLKKYPIRDTIKSRRPAADDYLRI